MSLRIMSLVILALGTILFSVTCNRYEAVGENLLQNPQFQNNFKGWLARLQDPVSASDGVLRLSNAVDNNNHSVAVAQTIILPPRQHLLFMSCEARGFNVAPGSKPWERARVIIVPLTTEGKPRYDVPHTLTSLEGTTPWTKAEQIFRIPEENAKVSIIVQLLNASGTLEVRSLSVRSAFENRSYLKWQHILMFVWFVMGSWAVWPLFRAAHRAAGRTEVLIAGCIILAAVLIPASIKYAITPSWLLPEGETPAPFRADLLPLTAPFRFELLPAHLDIYKFAHFLLFADIGYLLIARRAYRIIPIWMQSGMVTLFALTTESMQVLASGRGGSLGDVVIDMLGAGCGMFLAAAVRHRNN